LIERRVSRVVIGMLDPDPRITGRGQRKLRSANIVTDFFPSDLMQEVEELNREFTRHHEHVPEPSKTTAGTTRKPNLKLEQTRYPEMRLDHSGAWMEDWTGHTPRGFVIIVRNDTYEGEDNGTPAMGLRAQIWWEYNNGVGGPNLSPAPWVGEECGIVDIPVGFSKELILGIKGSDGMWMGWTNPKIHPGGAPCAKANDMLPDYGIMHVRLIGNTNEVWFSADVKWEWDNPRNPHIKPISPSG
jgi:hypothetical protein